MIAAGFVRGKTACLFIVIVDKIITAFQRIVSLQSDERMNTRPVKCQSSRMVTVSHTKSLVTDIIFAHPTLYRRFNKNKLCELID